MFANSGWQIVQIGLAAGAVDVRAERGFDAGGNVAGAVVVVQAVGKHLFADAKAGLAGTQIARRFRQRQAETCDALKPRVVDRQRVALTHTSPPRTPQRPAPGPGAVAGSHSRA